MPANYGFGANDVERLSPPRPPAGEPHPKGTVEDPESRSRRATAEQGELLPERHVLQCQSSASPEGCAHGAQKSEYEGHCFSASLAANSSSSLMIEFWQRNNPRLRPNRLLHLCCSSARELRAARRSACSAPPLEQPGRRSASSAAPPAEAARPPRPPPRSGGTSGRRRRPPRRIRGNGLLAESDRTSNPLPSPQPGGQRRSRREQRDGDDHGATERPSSCTTHPDLRSRIKLSGSSWA